MAHNDEPRGTPQPPTAVPQTTYTLNEKYLGARSAVPFDLGQYALEKGRGQVVPPVYENGAETPERSQDAVGVSTGWLDRNYRALMIGMMGVELFLLGVLVVLEWVRR